MHADPITHAAQYTDRLGAEADALQAAEIAVDIEIREAFEAFYAGDSLRRVPTLRFAGGPMHETTQAVSEAISDTIQSGEPLKALVALLQGRGDVAALTAALYADYARRNAEDVAAHRVENDPPQVYSFLFREAA